MSKVSQLAVHCVGWYVPVDTMKEAIDTIKEWIVIGCETYSWYEDLESYSIMELTETEYGDTEESFISYANFIPELKTWFEDHFLSWYGENHDLLI